tara:strand:- start:10 stop:273 length:264 start_codon:yes stop_codon:yes gene_type:complete
VNWQCRFNQFLLINAKVPNAETAKNVDDPSDNSVGWMPPQSYQSEAETSVHSHTAGDQGGLAEGRGVSFGAERRDPFFHLQSVRQID